MELNFEFSGFRFSTGPDPERPERVIVSIFKDGAPFADLHGRAITRGFSAKTSAAGIEEFCRRFATDDAFRNELLVKQTLSCC
ncbi:MAG TPA: hypothetical protein VN419_00530 [Humidesulfovibrio sp.]|uniref:hypothetical protein n=1 Tax=Humidesulfovibrio sp. TaxID=2910988 RepID=UPI002CF62FE6|nr:hypothetical protein [Humidesulfovibrio sp.]HWR02473.1 hypothetical protein [Humidesulfovibrio sp.]